MLLFLHSAYAKDTKSPDPSIDRPLASLNSDGKNAEAICAK